MRRKGKEHRCLWLHGGARGWHCFPNPPAALAILWGLSYRSTPRVGHRGVQGWVQPPPLSQGSILISPLRPKSRDWTSERKARAVFWTELSVWLFHRLFTRSAALIQLLFIVYLTSAFDHSLCRQKPVFVALSQGSLLLPLTTPQGPCRRPTAQDRPPSPSAAVQHGVGDKPAPHTAV